MTIRPPLDLYYSFLLADIDMIIHTLCLEKI